jgi:general secretion pathway protein G
MVLIIDGLNAFKEVKGSYPTTAQGLAAVAAFVAPATIPLKDPWGNPYAYASPGEYAEYDLVCLGADGKEGGEGEDADIDSWAEASLIGTWNEYTPTSALDIAFDDPMPSA